ncbi:hypothetical protein E2C01_075144 [Portunus trituberculatus]|uniref:Uncharacterized protein n=1 Tax=Portunus trituberculatus TaxID=210409 RepID=A0A5B7IE78_PORTR|nr:hypothetical protein [Portunus trituberculatus]
MPPPPPTTDTRRPHTTTRIIYRSAPHRESPSVVVWRPPATERTVASRRPVPPRRVCAPRGGSVRGTVYIFLVSRALTFVRSGLPGVRTVARAGQGRGRAGPGRA